MDKNRESDGKRAMAVVSEAEIEKVETDKTLAENMWIFPAWIVPA